MPLESFINILYRIINNTNSTYLALYVINHGDLNDNKLRERERDQYVRVMAVMMIQEEGGGAGPSGLARLNIHHIMCSCTSVYNIYIGTICVYQTECCGNRCSKPYYINLGRFAAYDNQTVDDIIIVCYMYTRERRRKLRNGLPELYSLAK